MTTPTLPGITATTSTESIEFFVPGSPAPQGSKKAFRNQHTGRIQMTESSKALGPWRERVALASHLAMGGGALLDVAVVVNLEFVLPRPKSAPRRSTPPATKRNGDIDKLARSVLDAITGVVVVDDAQVVTLHAAKRIAEIGETAGARIRVEAVA